MGGRFWAVSPSSYTHIGSFARSSLPATRRYASSAQRLAIETLGSRHGCHTCGKRFGLNVKVPFSLAPPSNLSGGLVKFHADHMPPNVITDRLNGIWYRKALKWKVAQRFYPQCVGCSNFQGGFLSQQGNRRLFFQRQPSYFHGLQFRLNHLTGSVFTALLAGKLEVNALDRLKKKSRANWNNALVMIKNFLLKDTNPCPLSYPYAE